MIIPTDTVYRYSLQLEQLLMQIEDTKYNTVLYQFYQRRIEEIEDLLRQHLGDNDEQIQ